eukprot:TRINITY_DN6772_c0_g1_i1.p1 TRINITY_DN6772_c0_g1~~TRINITY_DN6772_c0_g1_i1.p1  ORF type:complete len:1193 (+),score=209.68 TRINITY_DN6772_c0_g1_i1:152-3730(+)
MTTPLAVLARSIAEAQAEADAAETPTPGAAGAPPAAAGAAPAVPGAAPAAAGAAPAAASAAPTPSGAAPAAAEAAGCAAEAAPAAAPDAAGASPALASAAAADAAAAEPASPCGPLRRVAGMGPAMVYVGMAGAAGAAGGQRGGYAGGGGYAGAGAARVAGPAAGDGAAADLYDLPPPTVPLPRPGRAVQQRVLHHADSQLPGAAAAKVFKDVLWVCTAEAARDPQSPSARVLAECGRCLAAAGCGLRILHFTAALPMLQEVLRGDTAAVVLDASLFTNPTDPQHPTRRLVGHAAIDDLAYLNGSCPIYVPVVRPATVPPRPTPAAPPQDDGEGDGLGEWDFWFTTQWIRTREQDDRIIEEGFRRFLDSGASAGTFRTTALSFHNSQDGKGSVFNFRAPPDGVAEAVEVNEATGRRRELRRRRPLPRPAVDPSDPFASDPLVEEIAGPTAAEVAAVLAQRLRTARQPNSGSGAGAPDATSTSSAGGAAAAAEGDGTSRRPPCAGLLLGDLWVRAGPLDRLDPVARFYNTISRQRNGNNQPYVTVGCQEDDDEDEAPYVQRNVLERGHVREAASDPRADPANVLGHVVAKAFTDAGIGEGYCVIAGEPSHGSDNHRNTLLRSLLYGPTRLRGVYIAAKEALSLLACGYTSGIVVCFGDQYTRVVPIVDGAPLRERVHILDWGSETLGKAVLERLSLRNRGRHGWGWRHILNAMDAIKERNLRVLPRQKAEGLLAIARETLGADFVRAALETDRPVDPPTQRQQEEFRRRLGESLGLEMDRDLQLQGLHHAQPEPAGAGQVHIELCGGSELWELPEVLFTPRLGRLLYPGGYPRGFMRDHFGRSLPWPQDRPRHAVEPPPGWQSLPTIIRNMTQWLPPHLRTKVSGAIIVDGAASQLSGLADRLTEELWPDSSCDDEGEWELRDGAGEWSAVSPVARRQLHRAWLQWGARQDPECPAPAEAAGGPPPTRRRGSSAGSIAAAGPDALVSFAKCEHQLYGVTFTSETEAKAQRVSDGQVLHLRRVPPRAPHPVQPSAAWRSLPDVVVGRVLLYLGPLNYANQRRAVEAHGETGALAFRGMAQLVSICRSLAERLINRGDVGRGTVQTLQAALEAKCPDRGLGPLLRRPPCPDLAPLPAEVVNMPFCQTDLHEECDGERPTFRQRRSTPGSPPRTLLPPPMAARGLAPLGPVRRRNG